jgi:hypothetical protein
VTLQASYDAARYRVLAPVAFTLRVGQRSGALRASYAELGVNSAAFLTACNPRSRRMGMAWNAAAMRRLYAQLQRRRHAWRPGCAADPAGLWPDEESVLLLGIGAGEACQLARQFHQNALLLIGADATPRLHWLRPGPSLKPRQRPVGSTPKGR